MEAPFFFVLGLPKSGTTWVQKSLDAHPHLICRGEGKFMAFRKELQTAAAKYSNHIAGYQKKVFGEDFFSPIPRTEFERLYRSFIEGRLIGEGVPDGILRVGNKDPEHGPVLSDLARYFPGASFIHVIRDPRDVAVSTWHHMRRVEPGFVETIGDIDTFARQIVGEWRAYVRGVRRIAGDKAVEYIEIRYEDLHAAPAVSLAKLYRFLGVSDDEGIVTAALHHASFERASGGRARGSADPGSFYRKGDVGDFRNHLSSSLAAELLDYIEDLAADLDYA